MDTAIPEEKLREVLDQIARKVTEDSAGIRLTRREPVPEKDMCTVHISFCQGFRSSLSLRVDTAMLTRLTQSMLDEEDVTPQDLEDVAKEYLNVLCGHIAAALYRATRVVARLSVPSFHRGAYNPAGHREQFVLSYAGDREGTAQLVHHVPAARGAGEGTEHV